MSGRLMHKIWSAVNTKTREGLVPASSRLPWRGGYKIADRYEIHKILGEGGKRGIGRVYICYDHELRETVALKTVQDQFLDSENKRIIFNREVRPWTQFEKHPYIVRAQWVKLIEGRLFIGMEYIAPDQAGRNTLKDYLGQLSYTQILKVGIEICLGVEYAYGEGIDAHRDIRPENIIMTMDKRVKITDFGLVKALQEIGPQDEAGLRAEGGCSLSLFRNKGTNICGTPTHMAPEQFDGYADRRSDIYAFGIVLYQMVSDGMLPFVGSEWEKLHRYKKPERIPSPLFPIIEKCLAKKPEERYRDFKEIRETLEAVYLTESGQKFIPPKKEELEIGEWI
ncbi:MAG: serine/threonine-protein kinase, partial [Candidatus Omnitrophota bacterium]